MPKIPPTVQALSRLASNPGMSRLIYLSNAQIPSRSTNALQIVRMCEGFRRAGSEVTLVHPGRIGNCPEGYAGDVWKFYGVRDRFDIVTLPPPLTPRLSTTPWISRTTQVTSGGAYFAWRSAPRQPRFVCYTRSWLGAWIASRARQLWRQRSACTGIFLEVHDEPREAMHWSLLREADGICVISAALRDRLVKRYPELARHTWVEPDGVDLDLVGRFGRDRLQARQRLELVQDGPLVVYSGRVNSEKGADVVLEAARLLQRIGARVVLVGKVYDSAYETLADRLGNVTLTGFLPPSLVPEYLTAADIVVLPSTERLPYAAYTSPLKLFEYMACQRPIVASNLPVLREILTHERNALLYPGAEPSALAAAVERLWLDPTLASRISEEAWRGVQELTWMRRAQRILTRMEQTR
jgi:glycosyltransferase involved in cell wall biosynthesis